jgi:hypothetical protein
VRPNFSQRTHPIHFIGPKTHILGRFGPFCYCTNVDTKLVERVPLTHKFAKQSRIRIFRNEHTQSTPLDPKLMFWAFRTISLLHKSRCKTSRTGAINAQVRYTKSRPNFSQQTHPIHSIRPKTQVLGGSKRFVAALQSMQNWPNC